MKLELWYGGLLMATKRGAKRKANKGGTRSGTKTIAAPVPSGGTLFSFVKEARGGKLGRSEVITVRLDPKLRYFVELAARKQRRTVSSFVEWALDKQTGQVKLDDLLTINEEVNHLWDVDEADRFAKLAFNYPHLLTHDEQRLWKLIQSTIPLWLPAVTTNDDGVKIYLAVKDFYHLHLGRLREYWTELQGVASGELPSISLQPLEQLPELDEKFEEVITPLRRSNKK